MVPGVNSQGGTEGTIIGVDEDGDLPVFLKTGKTAVTRLAEGPKDKLGEITKLGALGKGL